MNKQTAVEWLFEMLNNPKSDQVFAKKLLDKAKEMEKEQIIFAHVDSCNTMNCQKTAKEKLKCSCGQYFWEQNFK